MINPAEKRPVARDSTGPIERGAMDGKDFFGFGWIFLEGGSLR